jgi:hypothetical protein
VKKVQAIGDPITLTQFKIEGGENYTKEDHSFQELDFKLGVVQMVEEV